ncbi:MAG: Rpn family recombination-promoting nuclease/putative transposase [Clostridium sp.]
MSNETKKDMYHIHDKSYKDLYSKKEIAIDLFENYVKKEFTKDLKVEDLTLVNKSFIASDYEETESDIVYKAKIGDTEAIFYILLEFQSRVDYRMPLRLLFYIVEILREFAKNENHKKTDKNIKIPAVVPIVLYNGKQVWDVPTEFRKMFYNEEKFHSGILNFTYDIFDVNNGFTKEELLDQKITAMEFMNRIKDIALFFDGLSEEELKAIKNWIKNTTEEKLAKTATEVLNSRKEEVLTMVANNAFMLKELKDEGKKEKQIEIAKNLLDVLEDEIIAKKTGLDIEKVIKLRKEYLKI